MKKEKFWHGLEIVLLFFVTAAVLFGVIASKKSYFSEFLPFKFQFPTLVDDASDGYDGAGILPAEPEEEWSIPEVSINYDEIVASEIEQENFNDTVVIGNSQAQALSNFGLLKNADFVTRIGLSINKVLTSSNGNAPIEDLYGKKYSKAVFVFGENELGWPYPQNFINEYKKVISKVQALNPGIEVYCQSVFPVTTEHSEKNINGVTNENVTIFNDNIQKMCEEIGAHFMPASEAFYADDGALPADAAKDGVHFNYDFCKIWAGDMSTYLGEDVSVAVNLDSPEASEAAESENVPSNESDTTEYKGDTIQ